MAALGRPAMGGSTIAIFVIMGFALGIAAVWTYAAIRPRFGAGARTAVCAGLLVWFFSYLYNVVGLIPLELFPTSMLTIAIAWGLVEVPLATVAGAWLYKEEG
jgi:hypothetical protein